MDSTDQYPLILCVYNIDVVEIIHGQYLKGFLLNHRKCRISFLLRTPSLVHAKESYTKAHVPRGWAHNLVGLIIIKLLSKYSGGSLYL